MRYAIIVAAGQSLRYGDDKLEKELLGKAVLSHSVDVFKAAADVVVVVGRRVEGTLYAEGGETRFCSVRNGLEALPRDASGVVAVHDGARPFVSRAFVERLFDEAERYGSAVPRCFVTDTLYSAAGEYERLEDRSRFFTVQTPQVFELGALRAAFERADGVGYPDESAIFGLSGKKVRFTEGLRSNIKLTYKGDLPEFRVGNGFDVHPLCEGEGVLLGGVKIPFDKRLAGHSDADVVCHAVCDAILSASGNKDIGHQFPDSDPAYKGADSTVLLGKCVQLARSCGYEPVNISAVVICQAPKIAPYADAMAGRLAEVCGIAPSCVSIAATTTERLGALGNGDGIAAEAVALLRNIL